MSKLTISAKSAPLLDELHQYVVECNIRGTVARFRDVASDRFDGAYTREELGDLIRRRLLTVVRYGGGSMRMSDPKLCGTIWTVDATERLVIALWPDRVSRAA